MQPTDLTIQILQGIRDEIRETRTQVSSRIDAVSERVDETNAHLQEMRSDLSARIDETNRRIVESEIRTATAITDLAGTVRGMTDVLRSQGDLRPRLERCEREIAELKRRSSPQG
jgi:uncharacterized coiled-coil DUF342 family protein